MPNQAGLMLADKKPIFRGQAFCNRWYQIAVMSWIVKPNMLLPVMVKKKRLLCIQTLLYLAEICCFYLHWWYLLAGWSSHMWLCDMILHKLASLMFLFYFHFFLHSDVKTYFCPICAHISLFFSLFFLLLSILCSCCPRNNSVFDCQYEDNSGMFCLVSVVFAQ